jgi:hypothetical protein
MTNWAVIMADHPVDRSSLRIIIDSYRSTGVPGRAAVRWNGHRSVHDNIISNIGTGSPDSRHGFDDGSNIDTLVIENSTFYNLTSASSERWIYQNAASIISPPTIWTVGTQLEGVHGVV